MNKYDAVRENFTEVRYKNYDIKLEGLAVVYVGFYVYSYGKQVSKGFDTLEDAKAWVDNQTAIQVEINIAGHKSLYTMYPCGKGNYPYDCITSEKYPNDEVYYDNPDGSGGWLTLRKYELGEDGIYRLPYGLI